MNVAKSPLTFLAESVGGFGIDALFSLAREKGILMCVRSQSETIRPACPTISEEAFRAMTFQVGFCTSQGVLLASDLKKTSLHGYTTSRLGPKIEIHANGNFAHCSAGDLSFTSVVIDEIEKEISRGTQFISSDIVATRTILDKCTNNARQRDANHQRAQGVPESKGGYTMLVFRENGALSLWTIDTTVLVPDVQIGLEGQSILGGSGENPAAFFLNHYAGSVSGDIRNFIPLAVHTVLMAKNDQVEGVQVGIFTLSEFRILSDAELQPHKDLSAAIDFDIRSRLVP